MRGRRAVLIGGTAIALWLGAPGVAPAALAPRYTAQVVDRPVPEVGGAFGQGFVDAGDLTATAATTCSSAATSAAAAPARSS